MTTTPALTVTVVAAWPDRVQTHELTLPAGATLADALAAVGLVPDVENTGIWGKNMPLDTPLNAGDRIELYRPISADPKLARHRRASEQGYRWQGRTRRAAKAAASSG